VSGKEYVWVGSQPRQVKTLLASLPVEGWTRLSAGDGAKGPRWYDWRWLPLAAPLEPGWCHWLLVRRSMNDPTELTAYIVELISIYGILGLQGKEATTMGTLRFADLRTRPTEVLDLTSLTVNEFQQLVPPFEATFQAHMAHWRLDGKPRTARRYTTYKNCPLPTPEDRLLFLLVYLKTYPLQVVQGRLFGMGQSKAHQWIHVLLVVLRATLRALGDAPSRSLTELAQRLGVAEADAAAMVVPTEGAPPSALPTAAVPVPASPLLATMAPNGASSAPRIRLSKRAVIAARKRATRSKTCC
jgi:Helix-turn-helix of DDE superfamily endonuclease